MKKDFEYLDSKKVLKELKSSLNGLSEKEAKSRIKTYGLNELPKEKEKSVFQIFLSAINDPIIYVLVVAAILSFIVGEYLDGFAIIFIIMVDAVVSTVQEIKAEKNSEALKDLIKVKVKVVRENKHYEIDSSYLVPGDIIIVEPGTKVSSDARIINSNNLTVESLLSVLNALQQLGEGESYYVQLGSNNIAKLSDEQKAIATKKGWTLQ